MSKTQVIRKDVVNAHRYFPHNLRKGLNGLGAEWAKRYAQMVDIFLEAAAKLIRDFPG